MSSKKEQAAETAYKLKAGKDFQKQFKKIGSEEQKIIRKKIEELKTNPRPEGVRKLKEYTDFYRIRIGKYRVIYEIIDSELIVIALRVSKREDVYKNLDSI